MNSKSRKACVCILFGATLMTQTAFTKYASTEDSTNSAQSVTLEITDIGNIITVNEDLLNQLSLVLNDEPEKEKNSDVWFVKSSEGSEDEQADDTEETGSTEAVEEESEFANRIVVDVDQYLNIRNAPSQEGEIVGKLYTGSAANVLERGDEWTKISSGTVEGYVSNEFVKFGEEAEALAREVGVVKATVNTETLKVREQADINSTVLDLVAAGEEYDVVEELDGWVAVQYSADTVAYLSAEFVDVELILGEAISIEEEQAIIAAEKAAAEAAAQAAREAAEAEAAAAAKAASQAQSSSSSSSSSSSVSVDTVTTEATQASYDDAYLLAALVYMEAGSECYEGKLAVANVVLNRVRSGAYPGTISGVIYARGQFTGANSGKLARILAAGPTQECVNAANEALAGTNNIGSYTNFIAIGSANTGSYSEYTIIGNHCFYRR